MTDDQLQHAERISDLHGHIKMLKLTRSSAVRHNGEDAGREVDEQIAVSEAMLAKELAEDQAQAARRAQSD